MARDRVYIVYFISTIPIQTIARSKKEAVELAHKIYHLAPEKHPPLLKVKVKRVRKKKGGDGEDGSSSSN